MGVLEVKIGLTLPPVRDSRFRTADSAFQALDSRFFASGTIDSGFPLLAGFGILWAVLQIPWANISWILESGFPYVGGLAATWIVFS